MTSNASSDSCPPIALKNPSTVFPPGKVNSAPHDCMGIVRELKAVYVAKQSFIIGGPEVAMIPSGLDVVVGGFGSGINLHSSMFMSRTYSKVSSFLLMV